MEQEVCIIVMETEISQILAKLGILPNSKANTYLKALILTAVSEPDKAESDYLRVAKEHGVTASFVKTVIRNTIVTCWNKDSMDILNQHFGAIILNKRTKPTNRDLIFMIATALREKYQILPEEGEFEWPQISEEEKAMLDYDETQEDPIFEDDDFVTSDRED